MADVPEDPRAAGDAATEPVDVEENGSNASSAAGTPFPIVGLGASAGGLEALRQLLGLLPLDTGMAFVVIQHLDPDQPSMLTSVLSGVTRLPVVEAANGMPALPNRVRVVPPSADLVVRAGVLGLQPRHLTGRLHLPIDSFFRSLGQEQRRNAIGVVLSGSGSDGTEGLRAIKAHGGIALAQSPESAQFRSMPESALAAAVVDFRGTPGDIARELERLGRNPYVAERIAAAEDASESPAEEPNLVSILALVARESGIDFGAYKRTTIVRRIERRMALRHTESLREYVAVLNGDAAEVRLLGQDLLIHVTSFFRDPAAFAALEREVFRPLGKNKTEGEAIRIWIPGCSTGEEVYSIAICLLEALEGQSKHFSVKIFGSDLSERAIEAARLGLYPESALIGVSSERLSRFFHRAEGGYRIGKRIRDLCVFVKHDLARDPPFAKLDLISCRNILIYFDVELQRRVILMFHYCLAETGHLFLGQGEAIGTFRDLFAPINKEHRIFIRTGETQRNVYPLAMDRDAEIPLTRAPADRYVPAREATRQADHLLLARFAPPGVVVNERSEIVEFRGRSGAFLESPPGQPETNVLRMARKGILPHLHEALERAKAQSTTTRAEGLRVETETGSHVVDLEVIPLTGAAGRTERFFLILFHEESARPKVAAPRAAPGEPPEGESAEAARLKAELLVTNDYLQSLIGEHRNAADDLSATNEELIATNEEFQSTNEELQSAKEELQSANEELTTVNDALRNRNADLDRIADDLVNVLASVEIPVITVDMDLKVRRFTPTVRDVAGFIPGDVGRSIDDLKLKVKVDDLSERVRGVIRDAVAREWEVERLDGRWARMQIRPYRTVDNRLDGAVLSFIDVDILKRALKDAELARDYANGIIETVPIALVVLDARLKTVSANRAFYERFGLARKEVEGRGFFEIGAAAWDEPQVRFALEQIGERHLQFAGLEIPIELPMPQRRKIVSLSGRTIVWEGGSQMTLLAIDDVTALRALEQERAEIQSEKDARHLAERANQAKDLFLATLSHELRTPLNTILISAQLLGRLARGNERIERASAAIEHSAKTQAKLIEDLLDVSRIVTGKLHLDLGAVDLTDVVKSASDAAMPAAEAKALHVEVKTDDALGTVYGDAFRLQQVVSNLLVNAIKFTPHGGRISVSLRQVDGRAELTVVDSGMGIAADVLAHLFERFVQADSSVTRVHGGLGLGLAIVRHLVEVHGGTVQAESAGEGQGATFRVTLPLGASRPLPPPKAFVDRDIRGVRVLVLEDDDAARVSVAMMLEELGAEVCVAPSAAEGLRALEEFKPQVLVSDIAMPGEDGYSFIRKVRSLPPERGGRIPAAALTALAGDEDRKRATEAGFQLHLAKPVDARRLIFAIGTLAAANEGVAE